MASYYLSATGSDSNSGTSTGSPWQTIGKLNAVGIVAGDSVYFNGGDSFSGSLTLTPAASSGSPVLLTSYGTGKATILCGTSFGIKIIDSGYVTVSNLIVFGATITYTGTFPSQVATCTNTEAGIWFTSSTANTTYPGAVVTGNEVYGMDTGIKFHNTNTSATAAHSGLIIRSNYVHDCGQFAFYIGGTGASGDLSGQIFASPVVTDNIVYRIPGSSGAGVSIWLFNASSALFERNACSYTGWTASGFPVSILVVECTNAEIRKNEVSFFYTAGGDGHGIDADLGAADTIIEYNYVHDSPNYGLFNYAGARSVFRYNIVERCGGGIRDNVGGFTYNNTFYNTSSAATILASSGKFYNNIITATSGQYLANVSSAAGLAFIGNAYQIIGGSSFAVLIEGATYTSIAAMRTAGFEKNGGINYGVTGAMLFGNAGGGANQLPNYPVANLGSYDFGGSSAAVGVGVPLANVSITAPTLDWHDNAATVSTPDAGAVAHGSQYSYPVVGHTP